MPNIINNLFGLSSGNTGSEQRSTSYGGITTIPDLEAAFLKTIGIETNKIRVTVKVAMGISTFYSAVNLLSDLLASQPYSLHQRLANGEQVDQSKHPLYYLIHNRPNAQMSSFVFRKAMFMNMIVYGYAIAVIIRNGSGTPVALRPYPSKDVQIYQDPVTKAVFFRIMHINENGTTDAFTEDDVIFLKDVAFDGTKGHSIVDWQEQVIKLSALTKTFAQNNFEKGAFMAGFVTVPLNATDEEGAKIYKERILKSLRGEDGGYGLAILGQGADYKPVTRSFVESQVIDMFNHSDKEIAKMLRTPLVMLGDTEKQTSFGKGIDSMYVLLTNNVIIPKAVQFESEVDYKCLTFKEQRDGMFTKINFRALLRGDAATYAEYATKMTQNGIYTINELRRLDEMSPAKGGDRNWVQQNMMPIDRADEILDNKNNGNIKGDQGSDSGDGNRKKVPAEELS